MLPVINPSKHSLSDGAPKKKKPRSNSKKTGTLAGKSDENWESMNSQLQGKGLGWTPYGPGGIESTEHEKAIVDSFRNFMLSESQRDSKVRRHDVSSLVKRVKTVAWTITAAEELSLKQTKAQHHNRLMQKNEYYARMRPITKKKTGNMELLKLSKKKGRPSRQKRTTRHAIGKSSRSERIKTPRSSYVQNCELHGATPDARIIIGTELKTYFNFAQAGCNAKQILALIQALAECNTSVVEQLNLSTNSFSNMDCTKVISVLPVDELVSLDFSHNTIGNSAAVELRDMLLHDDSNVQDLNLCACGMRRAHFKILNTAFMRLKSIKRLHLGRNKIDDSMAEGLVSALRGSNIEELDISWNNICNIGARFLECAQLKWLNIKMNAIKKGCEQAWASALEKNSTLLWLDISGAAFGAAECKVISKGLNRNHTLMEIHMHQMHSCLVTTNAEGFLIISETGAKKINSTGTQGDDKVHEWLDLAPLLCRQVSRVPDIDSTEEVENLAGSTFDAMKSIAQSEASGWITGGWTHFTFNVSPSNLFEVLPSGQLDTKPLKFNPEVLEHCSIHLQADNFVPHPLNLMHIQEEDMDKEDMDDIGIGGIQKRGSRRWQRPKAVKMLQISRILPPGRQFFYFSFMKSNGQRVKLLSKKWHHHDIQCVPISSSSAPCDEGYKIVAASPSANVFSNNRKKKQSSKEKNMKVNFYDMIVRMPQQPLFIGKCIPRPGEDETKPGVWSLMKSVFVPRLKEADSRAFYNTDRLMRQAFKHDWEMSNICAFITEPPEQSAMHQLLKRHYTRLMDIFYHAAGVGMSFSAGEQVMHKWSWMTFNKWVTSIGIQGVSSGQLSSHETDIIFITCNVKMHNSNVKPDRFLGRYEFLQAVVRLSIKQYLWTHQVDHVADAVDRFLQDVVYPNSGNIEGTDTWRRQRLYKEGVSNYYEKHLRKLRKIYERLSAGGGWADEVGGKMSYAEYKEFILSNKLLDGVKHLKNDDYSLNESVGGSFNEIHCKLAFTNSMMIVKNDIATFKHKRMTFVDFLEAIGRLCDYYDPSERKLEEKLPGFMEQFIFAEKEEGNEQKKSKEGGKAAQGKHAPWAYNNKKK